MKQLLYIDSNIYLRFYDSNQAEYKKLLKTLKSLKDKIFITKQIQYEIDRNKADVFRNSFDTYLKQARNYNSITLPEHLDDLKDSEITLWNKERKELITILEKSNKKLNEIYKRKMTLISESQDEVSKILNLLFQKAEEYSNEEILKARERKERGNPPGKSNDPLGDQINWEQLLSKIKDVDELYIISNDHDLLTTIENTSFLNPLLYQELILIKEKLKVSCYHSLSNALLNLTKTSSEKIQNLPSKAILEEINNKEEKDFFDGSYTIHHKNYDRRNDELQRLTYMFRHALITSNNFVEALQKLEYTEIEIQKFLNSKV